MMNILQHSVLTSYLVSKHYLAFLHVCTPFLSGGIYHCLYHSVCLSVYLYLFGLFTFVHAVFDIYYCLMLQQSGGSIAEVMTSICLSVQCDIDES